MPMTPADIKELKSLIAKARTRTRGADLEGENPEDGMSFGTVVNTKPEETIFVIEPLKGPENAMRQAKNLGGSKKLTFGKLKIEGKNITMNLMGKPVPGITRSLKKFFIFHGFQFKVFVITADGEEFEPDLEDDDTTISAPGPEDENLQTPDPDDNTGMSDEAVMWQKVSDPMDQAVDAFGNSGDARAPAVTKAWAGAKAAAASGDFKTALTVLRKLKPIVTATPAPTGGTDPAPETDPNEAKWTKLQGPLMLLYEKAVGNNPDNRSQLDSGWAVAMESAQMGDFGKALAVAGRLKPLFEKAIADGPAKLAPEGGAAFQQSRVLWGQTRKHMQDEMTKLKTAIVKECEALDDMDEVVQEVDSIFDHLSDFDDKLERALDAIASVEDGPNREKLKTAAGGLIQRYQAALESDFFKDVDTNNGFVNVTIRSKAIASLGEIQSTLAA